MAIPARRRIADVFAFAFATAATLFGLVWLFWILWTTLRQGAAALNPTLFTQMTPPPGSSGGILNALYGSFVMILFAIMIGTPVGVAAGTYLAEHGRNTRVAAIVSFINDILLSAPSIVIGLFVYELVVRSVGHFSGFAGALSLAIILVPIVVRTTQESLLLIPDTMREAGFALGLPRWRVTRQILYKAAMSAILTGILLGVARIAGETAPLLFTALNNQFWSADLNAPLANLPVVIFQYAMSPYDEWHTLAWAARVRTHRVRAHSQYPRPAASPERQTKMNDFAPALRITPAEMQAPSPSAAVSVDIRDLNFYYGKGHALKDVSMAIAANSVTAIIGPSGCGKSTLLRAINRIYELYPEQYARARSRSRVAMSSTVDIRCRIFGDWSAWYSRSQRRSHRRSEPMSASRCLITSASRSPR